MPRMPATLPMPTRRQGVACGFMAAMNGAKVATVALTLVANTASNTARSAARSVSVPCEMPALAMTTSAPPLAMKSCAAPANASRSSTSTV